MDSTLSFPDFTWRTVLSAAVVLVVVGFVRVIQTFTDTPAVPEEEPEVGDIPTSGWQPHEAMRATFEPNTIPFQGNFELRNTTPISWFWVARYPRMSRFSGRPKGFGALAAAAAVDASNVFSTGSSRCVWTVDFIHARRDPETSIKFARRILKALRETELARAAQKNLLLIAISSFVGLVLIRVAGSVAQSHQADVYKYLGGLPLAMGALKTLPSDLFTNANGQLENLKYWSFRLDPVLQNVFARDYVRRRTTTSFDQVTIALGQGA